VNSQVLCFLSNISAYLVKEKFRMRRIALTVLLSCSICFCAMGETFDKNAVKSEMKRVADWQIEHFEKPQHYYDLNWTNAPLYMGMLDWAELTEKETGDSQ